MEVGDDAPANTPCVIVALGEVNSRTLKASRSLSGRRVEAAVDESFSVRVGPGSMTWSDSVVLLRTHVQTTSSCRSHLGLCLHLLWITSRNRGTVLKLTVLKLVVEVISLRSQMLGEGGALAQDRSFPVDDVDGDHKYKGNAEEDGTGVLDVSVRRTNVVVEGSSWNCQDTS